MFVNTAVMLKITSQLINSISRYFFCWDSFNSNITRADQRYDIHAGVEEGWGSVMWLYSCVNRLFPSSKNFHFRNKAKWKTFLMKISFVCMRIKNPFYINGFALSFALKKTLEATQKWPINPLRPNGDQRQYSPNIIYTLLRDRSWELIKWSPTRKNLDLSSNSLNSFVKEMYGDQFGEFVSGYWDLKG